MRKSSTSQERAAQLARAGSVDPTAPVIGSAAIEVSVPAEAVWQVLADVASWPAFVPGVSRAAWAELGRGPQVGSVFRWRNAGVPLASVVQVAAPAAELTWTGRAGWITAIHRNTIEPTAASGCLLTSTESMTGAGLGLLMSSTRLDDQLRDFVAAIAGEAGRRCA